VAACPACGGAHEGPCPKGGNFGDFVQVAETKSLVEAKLIAMRLEESDIEAEVLDQTFHMEPLPDVRAFSVVRVLVKRDAAEAARKILAEPLEDLEFGDDAPEGG
jgi:hypothetical protein